MKLEGNFSKEAIKGSWRYMNRVFVALKADNFAILIGNFPKGSLWKRVTIDKKFASGLSCLPGGMPTFKLPHFFYR